MRAFLVQYEMSVIIHAWAHRKHPGGIASGGARDCPSPTPIPYGNAATKGISSEPDCRQCQVPRPS